MNNRILYEESDYPIFQNRMYESINDALNCPKGSLKIVEDLKTGLVYNELFSSELMVYDDNYQNEQAVSKLFREHLETVADIILSSMGRNNLIEVGCGKGYFLELLGSKGFDVSGFDPTYEGPNSRIKRSYFQPGVMKPAQGLILRHVLEHIENPFAFLDQLKIANGGQGKIYIEVPCFDWICEHNAWFDLFYEHVNYFRLSDFKRMFSQVEVCGRIFGGQYLYAVAELSSLRKPVYDPSNTVAFPRDFNRALDRHSEKSKIVVWGGASKGVIFALLKARMNDPVDIVIDINPAKQGKYLAGTGLQVMSPEMGLRGLSKGSVIYVMNSNYIEEIKQMTNNEYNYVSFDNE